MNGIIFHGNIAHIGCSADFLFEPEVTTQPTLAIAVFTTGEKAYAEIVRAGKSEIKIHIGEYNSPLLPKNRKNFLHNIFCLLATLKHLS